MVLQMHTDSDIKCVSALNVMRNMLITNWGTALRLELVTSHLQMLKEITGVRGSTSTDILLAELGLKPLQHVWLLHAAKFWNSLAGKPAGNIYN